jgi:hypothetical protein
MTITQFEMRPSPVNTTAVQCPPFTTMRLQPHATEPNLRLLNPPKILKKHYSFHKIRFNIITSRMPTSNYCGAFQHIYSSMRAISLIHHQSLCDDSN